jgi:hypothetical protein
MTIHELKERSKKAVNINTEEYIVLEKLYILLDLNKDDFAKIVDAVGVEKLVGRESYWDRLQTADNEWSWGFLDTSPIRVTTGVRLPGKGLFATPHNGKTN